MRVLEVGPSALPIAAIRSPEVEYVGVDSGTIMGAQQTEEEFWRMVELYKVPSISRISFYAQSLSDFVDGEHGLFDVVFMGNVLGDPTNDRDIANPITRAQKRHELLRVIPDLLLDGGELIVAESITPPAIFDVEAAISRVGMRVSERYVGNRFWKEFAKISVIGELVREEHEVISNSLGLELEIAPYMLTTVKR